MTVLQMRERVAQEIEAAREIKEKCDTEGRTMNETEANAFEGHMKEAQRMEAEADRQERLEAFEAKMTQPQETATKPQIDDGSRVEVTGGPRIVRHGSLRAFKGPKAEINAYRSGRFLAAVLFDDSSSREWCRKNGIAIRRDTDMDSRGMVEGINAKGGFLVPDEFERSIIDLRETYGNARRNLRIKPMASDLSNEPKKTGGLTAYPMGEGTPFTESTQVWGNVRLVAAKWGVLTKISSELNEDTIISLADDLAVDIARAFAMAEDVACIDGDGTSTYHGIIGIRTLMIDGDHDGSFHDVSSGCDQWSEITEPILGSVMGKLPMYARVGAKWHCSPLAKVAVFDRLLRAAGGNTNANLAAGQPLMFNGYPIEEWPAMPEADAGAALNDKIMLMFGNLELSSKFGTRRGVTIKTLMERYADTDEIGILATERFDINHHSITGKTSADAGPIVGLLGGT